MEGYAAIATYYFRSYADFLQAQRTRAARAAVAHGEEADEGIHERKLAFPPGLLITKPLPFADVLEPGSALLRRLHQRLLEQGARLSRGKLRHAVRG